MRYLLAAALLIAAPTAIHSQTAASDPHPRTLDEFRSAVAKVLADTGVPGAGVALVRLDGVEWAGGIGYADRDARTPVTADTHFRAGSISKTFIASALVQLYEDGEIDLDTPVAELAPGVRIDNAWIVEEPVRVIHLLEHTAGFDDMHFNEVYNFADRPEMPLAEVLRRNPASRVVRWKPGTRMSYSNPGYAVAGYVIEAVTGQNYEDRIAQEIFKPVGMTSSSFHLGDEDYATLAKGYDAPGGAPVPYSQIYLRPAGNLHTTAADLGRFVHVLLNWGETPEDLVIDPEYLSNMEHPRTTLAARAGLHAGYGSGLFSSFVEGYPMLGHNGGIEGFGASFAYSTARDVGYVVLLNASYAGDARRRIEQLAIRYLKAGVEPPAKPEAQVAEATLRGYEGYYHPASFRNQSLAFVEWLLAGQSVTVTGNRLHVEPAFGQASTLVPTSDNLFRLERDPEPSRVFAVDEDGTLIFAGPASYAERRPRWRVESVRWPVLASMAILLTPLALAVPWLVLRVARRDVKREGGWLKFWLLCCSVGLVLPVVAVATAGLGDMATQNLRTGAIFVGSVLLPAAAIMSFLAVFNAFMSGAGQWLRGYGLLVSIAALIVSGYLSAWGVIAFRTWAY